MNIALLERTRDHILANPELHNQKQWALRSACGTTYCFAGWTVQLAGFEIDWSYTSNLESGIGAGLCAVPEEYPNAGKYGPDRAPISEVAERELGLTMDQAHRLFWGARTVDQVVQVVEEIIEEALAADVEKVTSGLVAA